jgi:hypothetical protein
MSLPEDDRRERLTLGTRRGGALLDDAEHATLAAIAALEGDAALLFARLTGRRPGPWRVPDLTAAGVEDVPAAVAVLADAGLMTFEVDDTAQRDAATRAVLVAACRSAGHAPWSPSGSRTSRTGMMPPGAT